MYPLNRLKRGKSVFALAPVLLLLVCSRAEVGDARAPADKCVIGRIVVNSNADNVIGNADTITLSEALARAAEDPADNTINFDPIIFGDSAPVVKLTEAIEVESEAGGHDCIDATTLGSRVTIDISSCSDAGIVVGPKGRLTLKGLTVRGGKKQAILVKAGGRLALEKVDIFHTQSGPGLALFGHSSAQLNRCRFINNHSHGVELHGTSVALLDKVEMIRNGQSGVACFDDTRGILIDNRLEANGEWNAVLSGRSRVRLIRCRLRGSQFAGIDASGASWLCLEECVLEKGDCFGIFATGGADIKLSGTQVNDYRGRAIELQGGSKLALIESRIENSGDYGLILFGDSSVEALKTHLVGSAAHGVSLRDRSSGRFVECVFERNRYSGIGCLDAGDGAEVRATRCLFTGNGMRPIYRGPMHIDPVVPTPLGVDGSIVACLVDPKAAVELYLDRAGEASRYFKTVSADHEGMFRVDCRDVPEGYVMTAAATVNGSTSEFNVIAGNSDAAALKALLGRTGPLSDAGGEADLNSTLRRWKPQTRLMLNVPDASGRAVERYMNFLARRVNQWTAGAVTAEIVFGKVDRAATSAVVIPIQYLQADAPELMGRGGVTYLKWDSAGYFLRPMEITLAIGQDRRDICPRVFAHEVGHALGLAHVRVGLLSRMQGSIEPTDEYINDFSPMMTYYDVLALQVLYDSQNTSRTTLRQLVKRGIIPYDGSTEIAVKDTSHRPVFSTASDKLAAPKLGN